MKGAALLFLVPGALAIQLPFEIPSFFKAKSAILQNVMEEVPTLHSRVAIIGAGAGGSSAAFWIGKAKERYGLDVEIDVYDKESYVGGRSTTVYPHNDTSLRPIELGASIFVKANKNMWRASEEFNLTRRTFKDEDYETGIWDGEQFILTFGGSWWDTLKVLWRYGINAPRKTQSAVNSMIDSYLALYTKDTPRWDRVEDVSTALGFESLVASTTSEYLLSKGVSATYISEVVEAATRVNYAQDTDAIHALEGACSMAADNAAGIAGGNWQVFDEFLKRSGANVYLNTPVTSITPKGRKWTVKSARGSETYKAVILAAPFHQTAIQVPQAIQEQIPEQPYINLHVTLLSTTASSPNASYFGLPEGTKVPNFVLTSRAGARKGGKEPEFNSLSYHGPIRDGEWTVKIFSMQTVTDEWLEKLFSGSVGWVYRKEWKAYPKLPPTTTFPPVKLDNGFYYVNSFEPFISTMETETISSRNVVDLFLNEHFQTGICGSNIAASPEAPNDTTPASKAVPEDDSLIYGWDC
ncbi:Prenylcysteine lyase-domain-containing protein [Ephemerocybe angulata]|uniref:Prenylcysteine lyase-domain-containing protein n=1 Tax=Ephemerocybe angulata TaxID=980116 RepID=A0A8H6MEJ2_9AGAR|nr:Prenylcysteine lyase-domain-containing protein [Tulosesus angulatus]